MIKKKELLKQSVIKSDSIGIPIILNTYHLSNVLGVRWEALKKLINNSENMYYDFYMSKKSGGKRKISIPYFNLKYVQTKIKEKILDNIKISDAAYGFVKNKSIVDNAKQHLNCEMVLNIDLKDFFPSIHSNRIYYIFNSICGYTKELSYCLTRLVTYNDCLPQGAPTSPILSNIVSYMLDIRLKKLSSKFEINYTRYADDITFSGKFCYINNRLLDIVKNIVNECGFNINENKTRFSSNSRRQEVTGIVVNNGKISVSKRYINEIRQEIYYIRKYGIKSHREKRGFKNNYYKEHLIGKIMFVKSIDNNKGEKLLKQFNQIEWLY